jgi:hypothetical protein
MMASRQKAAREAIVIPLKFVEARDQCPCRSDEPPVLQIMGTAVQFLPIKRGLSYIRVTKQIELFGGRPRALARLWRWPEIEQFLAVDDVAVAGKVYQCRVASQSVLEHIEVRIVAQGEYGRSVTRAPEIAYPARFAFCAHEPLPPGQIGRDDDCFFGAMTERRSVECLGHSGSGEFRKTRQGRRETDCGVATTSAQAFPTPLRPDWLSANDRDHRALNAGRQGVLNGRGQRAPSRFSIVGIGQGTWRRARGRRRRPLNARRSNETEDRTATPVLGDDGDDPMFDAELPVRDA